MLGTVVGTLVNVIAWRAARVMSDLAGTFGDASLLSGSAA